MKQKKQLDDLYIAILLLTTAVFATTFFSTLIFGVPLAITIGKNNPILFTVISSLIWVITVYLGTKYTTKFIYNTFTYKNSSYIVKLATILFVALKGIPVLLKQLKNFNTISIINLVSLIIGIVIFYSISKKSIKNNEREITTQK